ncbi:uncharacterized protein LOC126825258 [Patella vulgata]|uniref:uncharacterized protein LOC126825258 n=1 Tax=Patella vulgata TaxID=6465 RepID=UPI00217FD0F7|nr:uncharacterized protein LOC126825258 [Patella vulgata]
MNRSGENGSFSGSDRSNDYLLVNDTENISLEENDNTTPTSVITLVQQEDLKRLLQEVRQLVDQIRENEGDPVKACESVTKIWHMYYDNIPFRKDVGDILSECGYVTCTYRMLKSLRKRGFSHWTNKNIWRTSHNLLDNAWNYSHDSDDFAAELARQNVLDVLFDTLIDYDGKVPSKKPEYFVLKSTLSIINNIARRPENKAIFKNYQNPFTILIKFKSVQDDFIKVLCLLILAAIADVRESHLLTDDRDTIHTIIQWMGIQIDVDQRKPTHLGFSAAELAFALDKLSIDGNTEKILDGRALNAFQRMLNTTDVYQQTGAAKCIWTLSFQPSARKRIKDDKKIVDTLKRLKTVEKDARLLEAVTGALWVLFDTMEKKTTSNVDPSKPQHVFISYHQRDKETVRQIWHRLQREGYDVWIDLERMSGDLLEAMSTAVEDSSVVILCVSEGYKQDQRCHTTANYAYNQEKGFIPLFMQSSYQPDGWLGMLLASKLYFDFSGDVNEDFDENMDRFLRELNIQVAKQGPKALPDVTNTAAQPIPALLPYNESGNIPQSRSRSPRLDIREPSVPIQAQLSPASSTALAIPEVRSVRVPLTAGPPETFARMTRRDVEEWLKSNELDGCVEYFKSMTGKMLWQLKSMKKEAPNHYLNILKEDYELRGSDILAFGQALDELE